MFLQLFLFSFLITPFILPTPSEAGSILKVHQGEPFVYNVAAKKEIVAVKGRLDKTAVQFYMSDRKHYYTLAGFDYAKKPGSYPLDIEISYLDGKKEKRHAEIGLVDGNFKVQRLKLPKKMVDYSSKDLKRIGTEKKTIIGLWPKSDKKRYWSGRFIMPVQGRIQGTFGKKRILNGKPRKAHSGEDISAAKGTPVRVINNGVVVNTSKMFFNGNGVFVDHGNGLFSMYFHLSKINVKKGDYLNKGNILGFVGATGRATGPHLHVGVKLNGATINPVELTKIDLPQY